MLFYKYIFCKYIYNECNLRDKLYEQKDNRLAYILDSELSENVLILQWCLFDLFFASVISSSSPYETITLLQFSSTVSCSMGKWI